MRARDEPALALRGVMHARLAARVEALVTALTVLLLLPRDVDHDLAVTNGRLEAVVAVVTGNRSTSSRNEMQ